jgi:hypothetical protein
MLRWMYIQLIWLHPAPFRWRFGDNMLDDFDRAPNRERLRYLADAMASLARQWLLRPEFRHPEAPAATAEALLEIAAGLPDRRRVGSARNGGPRRPPVSEGRLI